jgi:hypothetical protein
MLMWVKVSCKVKKLLLVLCVLFNFNPLQSLALEQFNTEQSAQKHCPSDTVVWVNLLTGIFHYKGQRCYGITKSGAYVCKEEAVKDADRPSKNGQ